MQTLSNSSSKKSLRFALLILFGIVLLLATAYLPAIHGPFVFDDFNNVPQTNKPIDSVADLKAIAFANSSGPLGRPIPVASFALNYHFWGPETTSFKVVNLTIHAINTVLVFVFIRTILLFTFSARADTRRVCSNSIALVTCLLWAIHPLQVSTVMYVVQRMTLLMTLFTLLAMLLYLTARWLQANGRAGTSIVFFAATVSTILACFSKENGALIVVYVLLLELCVLQFKMATDRQTRIFKNVSIAIALSGCIGIIALMAIFPETLTHGYQIRDFSLTDRLATQPLIVTHYLSLFFFPDVANMSIYQDTLDVSRAFGVKELVSSLWLGGLIVVSLLIRKHQPLISFGILFYFASQLMESTILPLELAFEHRNYIGTIGLTLSFVYAFSWLMQRVEATKASYILLFVFASILSAQTFIRCTEWSSDMTLAIASVYKKPDSARARYSLASALMNEQRPEEAVQTLDDLRKTHKNIAMPEIMAFFIQGVHGVNDPERATRIERLLTNHPVSTDAVLGLENLTYLYEQLPDSTDGKEQIVRFFAAATRNKQKTISDSNKAVLHTLHSRLLLAEGNVLPALNELRRAASLNPENREIKLSFAEALAMNLERDQAREVLAELRVSEDKIKAGGADADFHKRLEKLGDQL